MILVPALRNRTLLEVLPETLSPKTGPPLGKAFNPEPETLNPKP